MLPAPRRAPFIALILVGPPQAVAQELLTDGGAESGNVSAWTLDGSEIPNGVGIFEAISGSDNGTFAPFSGAFFLSLEGGSTGAPANSGVVGRMSQTVPAPPAGSHLRLSGVLGSDPSFGSCDPARVRLFFADAAGSPIGAALDTGFTLVFAWTPFQLDAAVPPGAATVTAELSGQLGCGVFINTFFDDVSLTVTRCAFADCDENMTLNIDDIDCFVAAFLGADLAGADCDANGTLNIDDIDCFVASFLGGCP